MLGRLLIDLLLCAPWAIPFLLFNPNNVTNTYLLMVLQTFIPSTGAAFCLFFISDKVNLFATFYDDNDEPFIHGLNDDENGV